MTIEKVPTLDVNDDGGEMAFDYDLDYYISGPMSGYSGYNYPAFEEAAQILRAHTITVQSPHEIKHDEPNGLGSLPYEDYMEAALALLRKCRGIILLSGWPQSTGARRELALALEMDMPVYFYKYDFAMGDNALLVCMNRRPVG